MSTITVLTGVGLGGDQVLAIPLALAVRELTTYATLLQAGTFGEAREDQDARRLVDGSASTYLERLVEAGEAEQPDTDEEEEALLAEHTGDDAFFDATSFFGEEEWYVWKPEPRHSTAGWLDQRETELWARFSRPDTGWGLDYDPVALLHPDDRTTFEAELRGRGYRVLQVPELADLYLDPGADPRSALEAL